jgi:hypothetical protein
VKDPLKNQIGGMPIEAGDMTEQGRNSLAGERLAMIHVGWNSGGTVEIDGDASETAWLLFLSGGSVLIRRSKLQRNGPIS